MYTEFSEDPCTEPFIVMTFLFSLQDDNFELVKEWTLEKEEDSK